MKTCDVLVVGAGTAGAVCAKRLAQHNLDTVVIDRRTKNLIGKKVCGNATAYLYFDQLEGLVDRPKESELIWEVEGLDVYGPNMRQKIEIHDPKLSGIMIDRHIFGQRLVHEMIKSGVTLYDSTKCIDLLYENDKVSGVKVIDVKTNKIDQLRAKIIIDAGGYVAPVRNKIRSNYIENKLDMCDVGVCYREIREMSNDISHSKYATLCIDYEKCPNGYIWIFPGGNIVNIGLGVAGGHGSPNPKKLFYEFFTTMPWLNDSKIIDAAGGSVPVRRPLSSLVDKNLMIIGDAAFQTNPIDAGGIGYSMLAAKYAADVAKSAIDANDTSIDMLWPYNLQYMKEVGSHQAASECIKGLLQSMTNEEISFAIERKIFDSDDIKKAIKDSRVSLSFFNKLKKGIRGIRKLGLLKKINNATKKSQKAMKLYEDYPETKDEFSIWKEKEKKLFSSI